MKTIFFLSLLLVAVICKKYDVIVIGGGAAGETYAWATDEARDGTKVLLLERGRDESQNPDLEITNLNRLFPKKSGNHNPYQLYFSREPARDTIQLTTANAIGGGYAVAAAVFQKPRASELDYWTTYHNLSGVWNYAKIQNALREIENFSDTQATGVNAFAQGRGNEGILKIFKMDGNHPNLAGINSAFQTRFGVSHINDINGVPHKNNVGLSSLDRAMGHGTTAKRQTIYHNYLKDRANDHDGDLDVVLNAQVTKVVFNHDSGSYSRYQKDLKATEVIYLENGEEKVAKVKNGGRVILAAGAVVSSQILEWSGIGNCTLLEGFGIDCLVNLPGVGENLREQGYISNAYLAPGREDVDTAFMGAFFRSPIKPGPANVPDTEISYAFIKTGMGIPMLFAISVNLEPMNAGSIHITSKNPLRIPLLISNFSINGLDGDHYAWLFNETRNFLETAAAPLEPAPIPQDKSTINRAVPKATLLASIFPKLESEFHMSGTARMGIVHDPMAVCDEADARVFGTKNLYVVDSSFHPFPMRGHPNALIRAIAYTLAKKHAQED